MVRAILTVVLLAALSSDGGGQTPAEPKVVNVLAERFSFTPSEIRVVEGTVLELRITSDDTDHGFRLRGPDGTGSATITDVAIPIRGRGDVRVRFEAAAPGRYTFECSHVCGAGHGFMRGSIRVDSKAP
jgi:cytochrome c oxidase subunit II